MRRYPTCCARKCRRRCKALALLTFLTSSPTQPIKDQASTESRSVFSIIAHIKSPFRERRGTPRQGSIVPLARACIVFDKALVNAPSLETLNQFSHIWVIFLFHENTNAQRVLSNGSGKASTFTAKISPPRLHGKKVGVFSTRSPHRPNPIGLTMVRLDSVDAAAMTLRISAVDLMEGTPVLDVKPVIPYDVPIDLSVPDWVREPDVRARPVNFTPEAAASLEDLGFASERPCCRFYPDTDAYRAAAASVLVHDIRSVHQGRGTATGAGGADYEVCFDGLRLWFVTGAEEITVRRVERA
ncbi:unnamed protein product [Phaeothamnion confervicola]